MAEQFEMIFCDFVTFVLFTGCSSETKFVRMLQNEILFLLSHLVNSLIKSKTLQQLAKKTFVDTKSVLFYLNELKCPSEEEQLRLECSGMRRKL